MLEGDAVGRIFRAESGRSLATLIGVFADIDLAEDAVQEAFAVALRKWPTEGVPSNPGGWITTTARNHAIDRLRRESRGRQLLNEVAMLASGNEDPGPSDEVGPVRDDRLRLIFTCCHPALSTEAQVALTLRLLAGLSTRQVAAAFLVSEATMAARLARAKRKIRAARIPSSRTRPSCPIGCALSCPWCTWSTTPARPAPPDQVCTRRRSAWRGSWWRSCPTSQRWPVCWRCCC